MKMVMALIPRDQADGVLEALIQQGYGATISESRGGFLRQAQKMLFAAVREPDLKTVLGIIRQHCRTKISVESSESGGRQPFGHRETPEVGGAVVFVWELEQFETYGWQT